MLKETDPKTRVSGLQLLAKKGHKKARKLLGYYYLEGKFVEKNVSLAFDYLKPFADEGDPHAQTFIGCIYYSYIKEKVVEKADEKSFDYFKRAEKQIDKLDKEQCLLIYKHLSLMYKEGIGVKKDSKKSDNYYYRHLLLKEHSENLSEEVVEKLLNGIKKVFFKRDALKSDNNAAVPVEKKIIPLQSGIEENVIHQSNNSEQPDNQRVSALAETVHNNP